MPGSGDPYCSLVNVATAADGAPLLLISRLALHTKNILADPRVSLMLDERKEGDPLEGARIMLMGRAAATDNPAMRRRYLDRQPEAEMFAGFADFAIYQMTITRAHLVAGFGRIVDLTPSGRARGHFRRGHADRNRRPDIIAHMNADHAAALRLYATRFLAGRTAHGAAPAAIRKGSNCSSAGLRCAWSFPSASGKPGVLRQVLKRLAEARGPLSARAAERWLTPGPLNLYPFMGLAPRVTDFKSFSGRNASEGRAKRRFFQIPAA